MIELAAKTTTPFSDVFEAGKGQSEAEAAAPAAGRAAKADGGSGSIG